MTSGNLNLTPSYLISNLPRDLSFYLGILEQPTYLIFTSVNVMGDSFVLFDVSMENTTLNLPREWQSHAICAFPEVKSLFTTEKLIGNDK